MRAIDADAFRREIDNHWPFTKEEQSKHGIADMAKSTLMFVLNQMPTVTPTPQWIPCSERMPEYDGGTYLVTDYCEQIDRKRIHVSYCYMNKDGFWSDVPLGYKVIAWMPLPEPWKGEDDG